MNDWSVTFLFTDFRIRPHLEIACSSQRRNTQGLPYYFILLSCLLANNPATAVKTACKDIACCDKLQFASCITMPTILQIRDTKLEPDYPNKSSCRNNHLFSNSVYQDVDRPTADSRLKRPSVIQSYLLLLACLG